MAILNTYPTIVESPFIVVTIGGYKFGSVVKSGSINGKLKINFPNFIKEMTVKKTNGDINQYTITLIYAIQPGDDPNFVDRIFSSVGYGTITLSYGDIAYPSLIYKDEEALITDLKQKINFSNASITYTISATGTTFKLKSSKYNFSARSYTKPSTVIKEIISQPKYQISTVFTAMYSMDKINSSNWIATNDQPVNLNAKTQTDAWSYIRYLTSCMTSVSNNSTYMLSINSDNSNNTGTYFQVKEMSKQGSTNQEDAFEVDIGFPGTNYVSAFDITTNDGWSILMEGAKTSAQQQYSYELDDSGNIVVAKRPALVRSSSSLKPSADSDRWWSDMINFPINATMTVKGLVAPTLLLSYIKINVVFYGVQHNTSGMYFITEQVDTINSSGYKTTFQLQRVPQE